MGGAPEPLEAQIEIAEGAGQGDRAGVARRSLGRARFQRRERPRHLAGLMIEPLGRSHRRVAKAQFVDLQNRGVHDSVGQGLKRQSLEARRRIARKERARAREPIEIFENDAAVENRFAVLANQRGNLAERVLPPQRIVGIVGVGRDDFDLLAQAEDRRGDPDFAAERRSGRRSQDKHSNLHAPRMSRHFARDCNP